jgi:FlaG/FlaF family flagellin (archaellin)
MVKLLFGDETAASPVVGIVIMFILTITMAATVVSY